MAGEVGEDVAEEVGGDDQVEGFRTLDQLQGGDVDQAFVEDVAPAVLGQQVAAGVAEQAAGERQDIGLVHQGDAPGVAQAGEFGGASGESLAGGAADDPFGNGDAFGFPVLATAVEAFAVFPQDHQIDAGAGRDRRTRAHGAQVEVQRQCLAQAEDGTAVALDLAAGRGNGTEQPGTAGAQAFVGRVGNGGAVALEAIPAGFGFFNLQVGQEALQHLHGDGHDLTADTVTGDDAKMSAQDWPSGRRRYCGGSWSRPLTVTLRSFQMPSLMP